MLGRTKVMMAQVQKGWTRAEPTGSVDCIGWGGCERSWEPTPGPPAGALASGSLGPSRSFRPYWRKGNVKSCYLVSSHQVAKVLELQL